MRKPWLAALLLVASLAACGSLDTLQSRLIFQPTSQQRPGQAREVAELSEIWLNFRSTVAGAPVRLHGLWLHAADEAQAPVALYLHGARWDVAGSAFRIRQLQAMGFSVLGIDYRGFGKSDPSLPSETYAYEDAEAAWRWLAERYPERRRFIYGHSLGGAIAIELASRVDDESGIMVEGTFTSIPDVFSSLRFGWLPLEPLITQRFAAIDKVAKVGSPLLVIHGSNDRVVPTELGQQLYAAARPPKRFILVDEGTHRNAQAKGMRAIGTNMAELFALDTDAAQPLRPVLPVATRHDQTHP